MSVQRHEPTSAPAAAPRPTDPTGGRLVAWAEGLFAAKQMGDALCQTSFVPQHFAGRPEEAAAAIMSGDELGFTPMQSLQSLYVVSGKPALYARAMVALVLSAGHQVWTESESDTEVVVCGRRAGSERTEKVAWSIDRAERAGYTKNKKYQTDPRAMLYARASADVARRIAPDVLAGVAYTVEELEGEEQPGSRAAGSRKVRRKPLEPAPTPEPDPTPQLEANDDQQHAEHDDQQEQESISDAQSTKLHASFTDLGIDGRDARLAYARHVVGREVETSKELTKQEASQVIDAIESDLREQREVETPEPDIEPTLPQE